MLYDVLPPLLLFISFGGIIVVVSRVVLRMRHVQFSEDIRSEVNSKTPVHEESFLKPEQAGVQLTRNRLVHAFGSAKDGIVNMVSASGGALRSLRERRRQSREEKQEEAIEVDATKGATIQIPEVGMQDRLAVLAQRGREGLSSLQKEIANRIPNVQKNMKEGVQKIRERIPKREQEEEITPAPKSSPVIRLVRHTREQEVVVEEHQETAQKTGMMSKILKRDKDKTPMEKAADAIAEERFEAAEDILIPHIMKHSSDEQAYMLLGKAAIGKESWDEAIEIFQQVIKLNKNLVDAYADLGHAALNAGKFTLAIQSLQHARDMDASNIRIREELLFIARRMDNKVVEKGVLEELQELQEKA